jgi:membrane associated rhomboid family serine protease
MSWRDRPYAGDDYQPRPEFRIRFRKPSTVVTWLVIANVVIHFINVAATRASRAGLNDIFGLSLEGLLRLHVWQPVTYMFLHNPYGLMHIVFNMLLLYFIGSEVERSLGRDRFIRFYFACGIVGGLAYIALALIDPFYADKPLIGASGAVYGVLLAAIIFFPRMQIIFIIFPMPIRVFGLILVALLLLQVISPGGVENLGGEVCHVAGAATALTIFYLWGMLPKVTIGGRSLAMPKLGKPSRPADQGNWARKQKKLAADQAEVDRILAKVHDEGLGSLTRREKRTLARATRRQQDEDDKLGRTDRL